MNHVLRRLFDAGIPHLVLDHFALRLTPEAYERAFRRGVGAWLVRDESSVRRWVELASRKRRAFALLEGIRAAASLDDARALVQKSRGRRWLWCSSTRPAAICNVATACTAAIEPHG